MCRRLVLLLLVAAALGGAVSASAEPFRILYAEQIDLPVARANDTTGRKPQLAGRWPLRAYGREYDLRIEAYDSLARRLPPAILEGKSLYRGSLGGLAGSWLRLTVVDDEAFGAFWDGSDFYAIAPGRVVEPFLDSPLPAAARAATFVYRLSDTHGGIEHGFCGVGAPTGARGAALNQYRSLVAELQSVAASSVLPLQIEVAVLGDFPLRQRFSDPVTQILATVNIADGIFTSQVGVAIVPTDLQVFATAEQDPFLSTDGPTLLRELGDYRNSSPVLRDRGLAHLMTGKNLDGTVAGIAFLGALCNPEFGVGLTEDWRDSSIAGLIMAHELGHNFGAPHDGEAGSACASVPRDFLMAPAINFSTTFSSCSLTQMQPHIQGAACVVPLQKVDALVEVPATVSAFVNEPFDIQLEVRSIGDLDAQAGDLRIGPAIGFALIGAEAPGAGPCSATGSMAFCNFAPIPPGESRQVTLHALASFPGHGSAPVELRVSNDRNLANNFASLDVESVSPADIELSLPAGVVGGRVGDPISFSFDVRAVGSRTARNATAEIILDSLQVVSVTPSAGSCPVTGVVVLCSFGDLPSGASRRVDVTVRASQVLGQFVSIRATADNDFNDANDRRGFPLDVRAVRDLGLTMPVSNGVFVADAPFDIVMVLRSNGLEASAPGTVTLAVTSTDLPTLDSVVAPGGSCTIAADTVTCAYGSLAAGEQRTITVRVHAAVGNYTFRTRVDTSADDIPSNNEGQFFASVRPAISVGIDDTTGGGSPVRVFVNGQAHVQARLRSFGALAASDVGVRAEIPPEFAIIDATLGGGSCARAGQVITCTRATLPGNEDALFNLVVEPTQPGNFQVDVTASAPGDAIATDNALSWLFEVREGLDVGIEPPAPAAVLLGVPQTLPIIVRNGALPANPSILVQVPGFVIIEAATFAGGVCQANGTSSLSCFLGSMAPREMRQIDVRVRATFMSNFAVTIQAFAGGFDINPANDTATLFVTVSDRQGDAGVQLSAASATGRVAERFAYPTVTVTATSGIDEARLYLTFDASVTGIGAVDVEGGACTNGGPITNLTMTCLLGSIETGTSRRISVELSGSRAGSFMSFVTLVARNDTNVLNDTAQVSVSVSNPPPPPPPPPQSSGGGGGGGAIETYWASVLLMFAALAFSRRSDRRRSRRGP